MGELDRRNFLLDRDGVKKTIDFYRQAIQCYKRACQAAITPREDNEVKVVARGKGWAKIYADAAYDCRIMLKSLNKKPALHRGKAGLTLHRATPSKMSCKRF